MGLKAIIDSTEGLSDEIASHYKEQDGKFVLAVERVNGLGLANAEKLENALRQERKAKEDAAKIIKQIPEGISIDDLVSSHTKLSELGDLSELNTLDEKLAERTSQLSAKFEADRKKVEDKFLNEIKQRDSEISGLTTQLQDQIVRGSAIKAISDNSGIPELLLPVVMSSVAVRKNEAGKMVAVVLGADGEPRLSSKPGSIGEMSIGEYVSELRDSEVYSRAFNGSDAAGGGTDKAQNGRARSHNISPEDAKDPAKYRAAKEAAARVGASVQIGGQGIE